MRKYQQLPVAIFYLLLLLLAAACNTSPRNIPFPQQESEFAVPVTEPLSFSEPQPLNWTTINTDSTTPAKTVPFNLDKIPSKPIDLGNFTPLLKPITDSVFDWNNYPDVPFDLEKIPAQPLKFKIGVLGQPKRTKSGIPRLKDGASESLLQLGIDQGIAGTIYSDFEQDKNGSMWIGTDDGLNRFDGEYCENYSLAQGIKYSWVKRLLFDNQGQLWIMYQLGIGVSVINKKTGIIKHITQAEGLAGNYVRSLTADDKGRIWICTNNGVSVVDQKAGSIKNITKEQGLGSNNIRAAFQDSKGRIWISRSGKGIDVINEKKGAIKHIDRQLIDTIKNMGVTSFLEDKHHRLWFGTFNAGIMWLDEKAGVIKQISSEQGGYTNVASFAFDEHDKLWMGTYGSGVYVFDEKNSTIKHFNTVRGLNNDMVNSICLDNHHQIWIGMHGGEANIYNTAGGNIKHLSSSSGLSNKTSFYYGFAQDSHSRIWVGSLSSAGGGGIDVIDENSGTLKNISASNGLPSNHVTDLFTDSRDRKWVFTNTAIVVIDEKAGTIKYLDAAQGISDWDAAGIFEDSQGQIWIGRKGLYVMNEEKGTIKKLTQQQGLGNDRVNYICEADKGQVWVGTAGGMDEINTKEGTIKHLLVKGLTNLDVSGLIKDSKGNTWLGTTGNGLFMINPHDDKLTKFTVANGLANMVIYTINERNGLIYVGTAAGLTVITPGNEKNSWQFKNYGKPQGFLRVDYNARSLLDKDGRLWFGIADVLTIMEEPQNDSLVPPAFITGLDVMGQPQNFVTRKSIQSALLPTDTIWNSEKDTFYVSDTFPPDTGYLQKNKISWDSISGAYNMPVNLQLPYDQNHITFHFTGSHLDNMNKTRYRYVLEGSDKTWSDLTGRATAEYRNLGYGQYTFKVSSSGFNGLWSKPAEISFTILPPWWKTWWAYLLYAIALLAAIFSFIAYRSAALKRENKILEEKVDLRTNQLQTSIQNLKATQSQLVHSEKMASLGELTAGIAHEIQNPLNFVNNFSDVNKELLIELKDEIKKGNLDEVNAIADDVISNEEKINHHGKRADAIVKGMLQHSRSSSGVKEPTDINKLADEYLRLAYHGLRAKDKSFNATMKTDFDKSIGNINVIPQDIGRVILNLITNAFYVVDEKKKQQPAGYEPTVSVSTKKMGDKVLITVKDNGNGIPQKVLDKIFQPFFTTKPTGQGTGLGLSLSYDIVKAHGGELKVQTKEGVGSEFIIILNPEK
jgi:signal transduction histidine kinase/ligand-binding sensor domain-containing protein